MPSPYLKAASIFDTEGMIENEKKLWGRTGKTCAFIQSALDKAGASGIVFGNSGGKDSALVGDPLQKSLRECPRVMMPCQSRRNFGEDIDDGRALAVQFDIETVTVDLSDVKSALTSAVEPVQPITAQSSANIAPRLRMTTLYAIAQSRNCLVAGTGNRARRMSAISPSGATVHMISIQSPT